MKQSKLDSWLESVANVGTGFLISWAVYVWVISPLFGAPGDTRTSFLITCIFTVTSLLRQYVIRRLFNGRSVGQVVLGKLGRSTDQ